MKNLPSTLYCSLFIGGQWKFYKPNFLDIWLGSGLAISEKFNKAPKDSMESTLQMDTYIAIWAKILAKTVISLEYIPIVS